MVNAKDLVIIANSLRRDVIEMTTAAGSGHLTSSLSAAEIISTLFFEEMSYDTTDADNPDNDEFILSKGHAAPIYYAALKKAGCISDDLLSLRKIDSNLEGHPIPSSMPWAKVATGSLGQGLSVGVGMAIAAKIQMRNFRTYVLMGDSECSEGSVWEAVQLASYYKLNNLCAIVDINKLGQRGETMLAYDTLAYKKRFESFGWSAYLADGHNTNSLMTALKKAKLSKKPSVILAKTKKGKGISFIEGKDGWHGKAMSKEEMDKALKEIPMQKMPKFSIKKPKSMGNPRPHNLIDLNPLYAIGDSIATREAYGSSLAKLATKDSSVIALDAEVSNSTFAERVKERAPGQFIECFIAEQNMVGMSLGLEVKDFTPFVSTFAAFFTRAYDQLRMAAISNASITFCGSHAGTSIGEDGASQMGLEDISLFRSLPNSFVFYPSDAVSTEKLVSLCSRTLGIKYIRTTRAKTPVIYQQSEEFLTNDFKVLRMSNYDSLVIVGAGITLHEALKAQEVLKSQGVSAAVIDAYCIKPFPADKFIEFVKKHGNKIIIAEDHYAEGGLGEAIISSCLNKNIPTSHLSVKEIPHSGTKDQLLEKYKINSSAIVQAAKSLIK